MAFDTEGYAEKIAGLLRKAESTTPEEAEVLVQKAQQLMTKYAITEEMITEREGKTLQEIVREEIVYTGIYRQAIFDIGKAIAVNNDCRILIRTTTKETVLVVIGFEDDVRRVKMLDSSVQIQAQGALAKYWKELDSSWMGGMQKFKDRREFLFGFAQGLHFQLHAAHKAAEREVAEEYAAAGRATNVEEATESVALVLRSKKERVSDWIDKEYGQLGSVSRRYSSGGAGARAAGTAAGRSADAGGRGRVGGQGRALTR